MQFVLKCYVKSYFIILGVLKMIKIDVIVYK